MKPSSLARLAAAWCAAALLLSPLSLPQAQVVEPPPDVPMPPRPPVILVPNEMGTLEPIHVRTLDVDVEVTGFLAETTLVMSFHNPNPRVLEGELIFPLPEGATLSGYGLDVGGELVDGVLIERERARVAFETEMRRGIDPGLAEWVQGSIFRTRIFPIPAEGGRTVKISYVSDLDLAPGVANYHLPLAYQEALERFHIRVAVAQGVAQPTVTAGINTLNFAAWEQQFVAETELHNVTPMADIVVAVPIPSAPIAVERTADGHVYFALIDSAPHQAMVPATGRLPSPTRVALLFDASASRSLTDVERELGLISAWAAENPSTTIELVVLRDQMAHIGSFGEGSERDSALLQAIREEPLDGGTDLFALTFPSELSTLVPAAPAGTVDYYLLFTDGLGSLGEPGPTTPDVPVIAVTTAAAANHAWMRHVAQLSGGAYVNLQRMTDDDALAALHSRPLQLAGVELAPSAFEAVQFDTGLADGGNALVVGRLLTEEANLRLRWVGPGGDNTLTTHTVSDGAATEGDLIARYWAQLRISDLALSPDRNRDELIRLGRQFGMVTPHTSYLVLETLEQHLQHRIPPAPSRTAMLEQYELQFTAAQESELAQRMAQLEEVVGMWNERLSWWNSHSEMPAVIVPGVPTTPDGTSIGNAEPTLEQELSTEIGDVETSRDAPARLESMGGQGLGAAAAPPVMARESEESGEASGAGPEDDASTGSPSQPSGTIAIQEWTPDTPYLTAMRGVAPDAAYGVYLDQVHTYRQSPAFFLDAASYLYQVGRNEEARRVLTNISELELGDPRLLRIVAYKLQEEGELDLAIRLFEEVLDLRPEEPQSRRDLALALAERANRLAESAGQQDANAPMADWTRAVALLDEMVRMPAGRFQTIEMVALMEANSITARMARWAEDHSEVALPENPIDPRLRENLDMDMRVILRWDTDLTDMDLWVDEPSGERCYYGNTRTAYGATYGRDYTQGYGPEEYLIRTAPEGNYTVQVNYFGSREQSLSGGTTFQADIFTDWGRPTEQRHRATMRLTSSGETVHVGIVTMGEDGATLHSSTAVTQ